VRKSTLRAYSRAESGQYLARMLKIGIAARRAAASLV